jgi:hypothetical protein
VDSAARGGRTTRTLLATLLDIPVRDLTVWLLNGHCLGYISFVSWGSDMVENYSK